MTTATEIRKALENEKNTKLIGTQAESRQAEFAAKFDEFVGKLGDDSNVIAYYEAKKKEVPYINTPADFAEFFGNTVWSIVRTGKIIIAK